MEVPIASYTCGSVALGQLKGTVRYFTAGMLRILYPTHSDYVTRVTAAANAAVGAGLSARGDEYVRTARNALIPPA